MTRRPMALTRMPVDEPPAHGNDADAVAVTRRRGLRRWDVLLLGFAIAVASLTACLPEPQRAQSADLLQGLVNARGVFVAAGPDSLDDGCTTVGDVQTRLIGEPGLSNLRTAWTELRAAAAALQAVCGQRTVLERTTTDTLASSAARDRWSAGVDRELSVACDHLRGAASALGRPEPC
jgi:hypothetical protein